MNTMSAQQPFENYLPKELGCDIKVGQSLKVEPSKLNHGGEISDLGSVRTWLDERLAEKPTGWVQFSDVNVWVKAGAMHRARKPAKKPDDENAPDLDELEALGDDVRKSAGVPLAAELATPNASYHLRHDGTGWIATRITRDESGPAEAVLERRTFCHSIRNLPELAYEVAWTPDESIQGHPLRPTAFRLVASSQS